jgi:MOSC domain-containing protein YiiM
MTNNNPPPKPPKDVTGIKPVCEFRSFEELSSCLLDSPVSSLGPSDGGTLSMIVLRPAVNERVVVESAVATVAGGVEGSGWKLNEVRNPGGVDQVCVMATNVIKAVAGEDCALWPPAGDQLFMDFGMSSNCIAVGDRVRVGKTVVMEMTRKPHKGCEKFVARYGADSLRVLNSPEGSRRRLRGIYFKVVTEGALSIGDSIVKVPPGTV